MGLLSSPVLHMPVAEPLALLGTYCQSCACDEPHRRQLRGNTDQKCFDQCSFHSLLQVLSMAEHSSLVWASCVVP